MSTPLIPQNPWKIKEVGFPWKEAASQKLKFLLNYAVLAPSIHNTQPWSFRVLDDEAEFFADASRAMSVLDPVQRQLVMSCGSALFNFRMAIKHYNHRPVVHTFPDQDQPNLIARVRIVYPGEVTLDEHRLFMAIKKRRTYRGPFEDRPITAAQIEALQRAAEREGTVAHVVTDPEQKRIVGDLVAQADLQQRTNVKLCEEVEAWMDSGAEAPVDPSRPLAAPRPVVGTTSVLEWGGEKADFVEEEVVRSPAIVVISAASDHRVSWLKAGQALSRLLLTATVHDLSASFLNQAVEVPAIREKLAALIGKPYPQLVIRIGYPRGHALAPISRQSVDEKIVTHALDSTGRSGA